jgi:FMN phosphatase YigB (HAD superfamily)
VKQFDAVLFDNGDTLFHKPLAPPAIAELASSLGQPIDEATAAAAYQEVKAHKRAIDDETLIFGRNRSAAGHLAYYTVCYQPLEPVAPGMALAFYRHFKTNPASMIPYPDTEPTLRRLHAAGIALGIVSNTGWNIRQGYERAGLAPLIDAYVLSFEHGIAKPERGMWEIACAELGVAPERTLMVGNNPCADSGAAELGCTCLILPAVERGAERGLASVLRLAGVQAPAATTAA